MLSLAFIQQPYAYVEPGLYSFYFAAVILGGTALAQSGISMKCLEVLVVITAAACFLYGAMSLNVYLFALAGGHADLSDLIPWGGLSIFVIGAMWRRGFFLSCPWLCWWGGLLQIIGFGECLLPLVRGGYGGGLSSCRHLVDLCWV